MKHTSDGSTASYYELPEGATELQHLISHRNMNAQDGEIFRAIYRKGRASHSDELRDAKKVLFYAQAEVERLGKLQKKPIIRELYSSADQEEAWTKVVLAGHEVDTDFDAEKERMPAIGTNGNDGGHYPPPLPNNRTWADAPPGATVLVLSTTTGVYHWADAFSDNARIYGANFLRLGLTSSSGWELIARRPGSDPGWVYPSRKRPNLPADMAVEVAYRGGARHRQIVDDVDWADVAAYRVVEALEQ